MESQGPDARFMSLCRVIVDPDPSDVRLLKRACFLGYGCSRDKSTRNGAILSMQSTGRELIAEVNDIPDRMLDTPDRRERPLKYDYIHHAEDGVIFAAARAGIATAGTTMYVPWYCCKKCAIAIVSAGIIRVVGLKSAFDRSYNQWKDEVTVGVGMLREARIECDLLDVKLDVPMLMDGKEWRA